ncbi:hypothetical protein TTRE_0000280701 [Trichuris trichiura]|uniref:Uncharacterized protein n=1 Tax=Trichuris trichiura TaxID=36087 RepID=A0A077Z214_TRITR|nr:hypothetical protein TTRE_0000280701 [Trichuris trichiura]
MLFLGLSGKASVLYPLFHLVCQSESGQLFAAVRLLGAMWFHASITVMLYTVYASVGVALEKPAIGTMNQLIPSLANAVISTLFPQLKLPNEMDPEVDGRAQDNYGYQQALTRQGVPFAHQAQSFGYPLSSGDFLQSQRTSPSAQVFDRLPEVGQLVPSENSRFRQMNLGIPSAFQAGQMPTNAQSKFAQSLWHQGGRSGLPTPTAQFENLPPSDFSRGYPPLFTHLTNPDKQDLFQQPNSLHGRRDLPPSYVYPFAESGSMVQPGIPSAELYSLGEPSKETVSKAAKMLSLISPNVHHQRTASLTPELLQAVENAAFNSTLFSLFSSVICPSLAAAEAEQDPRLLRLFLDHAKRVGQDTGAFADQLAMHKTAPALVQQRGSEQTISSASSSVLERNGVTSVQDGDIELCSQCINSDLEKMVGPWTQIYGNANALKKLYATLSSVSELLDRTEGAKFEKFSPAVPTFSRPRRHRSEMEIMFHNSESFVGELQKLQGVIQQDRNVSAHGKALEVRLPNFKLPVCLVKAGPSSGGTYTYMIWTETTGANHCRSHHVFARHADSFHRENIEEVGNYLKEEYENNRLLIMSALEHPMQCLP